MPGKDGMLGLPDIPVARTSCFGRSTTLQPAGPVAVGAVRGAHRPARAFRLLKALELVEGGEQGPALAGSFAASAALNSASQVVTAVAASAGWAVVVIGGLPSWLPRSCERRVSRL
jgi:hypothetical protein